MHKSFYPLLLSAALTAVPALADVVEDARKATADVLFDMDIENASFKINHDGYVDITFGKSMPEDQYSAAVARLKATPGIPGVLAGRGSADYCPVP